MNGEFVSFSFALVLSYVGLPSLIGTELIVPHCAGGVWPVVEMYTSVRTG